MGHCSSYDEVEVVDISLAIKVTALLEQMGTIIPSNISPGLFIQIAAEKNAINEETLDGENITNATTTLAYHRKQRGPQVPSTSHPDQTMRRRSLHSPGPLSEVQDSSMHGRRYVGKDFRGVVDSKWFSGKSEDLSSAFVDDSICVIVRINLSSLLKSTVLEGAARLLVPSWSPFNAIYCIQKSLVPPTSPSIHYLMLLQWSSAQSILS